MNICPHCERLMPDASNYYCARCGLTAWWPVTPLGPTYPVLRWGVAAIVAMWLVAFGRPMLLVYRVSTHDMFHLGMFTSISIIIELAAIILVIGWLWRAMANTDAFAGGGDGMSADWAFGSWFVPFVNLVLPFRVVLQVAREELSGRWVLPAIWVWWISYVASFPVTFINYFDYVPTFAVGLANTLTLGVAAIALGELILAISRAQQGRIDRAVERRAAAAELPRTAK